MPEYTAEIEINPDEFLSDCSSSEIKEIIEALIEDGHIQPHQVIVDGQGTRNYLDEEWDNICEKIRKSRLVMTQSDEDTIRQIYKGL
jgi:hypothetical protein